MVDLGANLSARDEDGNTPLDLAIRDGRNDVAEFFEDILARVRQRHSLVLYLTQRGFFDKASADK